MKHILKLSALLASAVAVLASCQKEFEYVFAENGPEMTVLSCPEKAYMGESLRFSVDMKDSDFALSTLKAQVYFDVDMVNEYTIRTKENGVYDDSILIPLLPDIPDGIASVVFIGQNVGQAITKDTVYVQVSRPDFDYLTLHIGDAEYRMDKTDDYKYSVTDDFPAEADAYITTPAVNESGDVIRIGWNGTELDAASDDPIPFSSKKSGTYTISVDLMTLLADPFGKLTVSISEAEPATVVNILQESSLVFPDIQNITTWDLDPDFFRLEDNNDITFLPVDGLYRITANFTNKFLKVEAMADINTTAVLNEEDGSGAVWVMGEGFGKPSIGPSWNTTDGCYCLAQVEPGKYQLTLLGGGSINNQGAKLKFYHQKGWGGSDDAFLRKDYTSYPEDYFHLISYGNDNGNLYNMTIDEPFATGQYYRFTLDVTAGVHAAVLSVEKIDPPVSAKEITFAGASAGRVSADSYTVESVDLVKGQTIEISGVDNLSEWYIDPDYFNTADGGITFNACDGKYRVELHPLTGYIELFRLKADGSEATLSEGALWMLAWGVANPVMTSQFGFDEKTAYCLAEVEPLVFQFTGVAVEETDGTTLGGRFRYDYVSAKYFAQNAWGNECGKIFGSATTVNLEGNSAQYLKMSDSYNIELADASGAPLELGATYRLTIDLTKAESDGIETIRFDKL